jgi:hypothetical protein
VIDPEMRAASWHPRQDQARRRIGPKTASKTPSQPDLIILLVPWTEARFSCEMLRRAQTIYSMYTYAYVVRRYDGIPGRTCVSSGILIAEGERTCIPLLIV